MRDMIASTWWSQRWLDALKKLDKWGRLARGRAYFKKGHILSLRFYSTERSFLAEVSGSSYNFYDVLIRQLGNIPEQSIEALVKDISQRPRLLAALLKHDFPEEIEELCNKHGIKLFPSAWEDFEMRCSCPDFAVPCKHIATVYYALVQALDQDPFNLFLFRGVDLIERLKAFDVNLDEVVQEKTPSVEDILSGDYLSQVKAYEGSVETLPFYQLQPLSTSIVSMCDEENAADGISRAKLKSYYRTFAQKVKTVREYQIPPIPDEEGRYLNSWEQFERFSVGGKLKLPHMRLDAVNGGWAIYSLETRRLRKSVSSVTKMLNAIAKLSPQDLARMHPIFSQWRLLVHLAMELIHKGAVVPMFVAHSASESQEQRTILWGPVLFSDTVASMVAAMNKHLHATAELWRSAYGKHAPDVTAPNAAVMMLTHITSALVCSYLVNGKTPKKAELLFMFPGETFFPANAQVISRLQEFLAPINPLRLEGVMRVVLLVRTLKNEEVSLNLGFRFLDENAQEVPETEHQAQGDNKVVLYRDVLQKEAFEPQRYTAISLVERFARAVPLLAPILSSNGEATRLPLESLTDFLFETLPVLKLLGVEVRLPKSLVKLMKPVAQVQLSSSTGKLSLLDRDAVFHFEWTTSVGETPITEAQFMELSKQAGKVIPWGEDGFVYLDPAEIERIRQAQEHSKNVGRIAVLAAAQTGEINGFEVKISEGLEKEIRRLERIDEIPVPQGIQAKLRPYQERGYAWLFKNLELGVGSLIADDMGLGKTLQVITLMEKLRSEKKTKYPHLVIVPTSLLINWQREIDKFAPELTYSLYYGLNRELDATTDVVLTSYGTARRDIERLAKQKWHLLVLDEAQAVKSVDAQVSRALRKIRPTGGVIAMTGTPVENRLMEYWSIFQLVEPGLLGSERAFTKQFVEPIEREHDPVVADRLKRITSPFMLRRLKTDRRIIDDLPDKIMMDHYVGLTEEQAALYSATLDHALKQIEKARNEGETAKGRAQVLALMTRLKQICNSPAQALEPERAPSEPDSKKGAALLEIIDQARERGQKVLVFTQFAKMGEILQRWLAEHTGRQPDFLQGSVSAEKRAKMVESFQNDPATDCLIVSLKAGGTGLNLVAATVVVHYDLWWNPAVEAQATDRAYRIGQKENVLVYRMITEGTFEERINDMINAKKELADLTVGEGEGWIGSLPMHELQSLFKLNVKYQE